MEDTTEDGPGSLTRPVDRVTSDAFMDILEAYGSDRITDGVCRLDIEDGTERRLVISDDLPALDDQAYARRELSELIGLFEDSDDLVDKQAELTIPVGDVDRVVAEAEKLGTVTVYFDTTGVKALLQQLLTELDDDPDRSGRPPHGDTMTATEDDETS